MYDFVQNRIEKACLMHHILNKKKKKKSNMLYKLIDGYDHLTRWNAVFPAKCKIRTSMSNSARQLWNH